MTKAMTLVTNIQMLNMCYRASCNLCKFYDTKLNVVYLLGVMMVIYGISRKQR